MLSTSHKNKMFVVLLLLLTSTMSARAIELEIVYPREGRTVSPGTADSTFIFGRVLPANAALTINGQPVPLYMNGAFLAYLPFTPGEFTFHCVATVGKDTAIVDRHVIIPQPLQTTPSDTFAIDSLGLVPAQDLVLRDGDVLRVSFKGTPGCLASFSIEGIAKDLPMTETTLRNSYYWGEGVFGDASFPAREEIKGIYTGSYIIDRGRIVRDKAITFTLVNAQGDTITAVAPGKLSVEDDSVPLVAELFSEQTVLRTAPGLSYYYFLPQGVRLRIIGRSGRNLRVFLADNEEAWVDSASVRLLPSGTQPPTGVVSVVRTENMGRKTRVRVFTGIRVPFRVEQITRPQSLRITFYGLLADTDWIRHDFSDPLIREIRWKQAARGVYQLSIELNQKQQWGYNCLFDENDNFIIDIKKAPHISGWPGFPLKNIQILLDPGHNPDNGAIGPTGLKEKDANLMLATVLAEKLTDKGAIVFLTRSGEEGAILRVRPKIAAVIDPDILLSLHHNALPDGVNPFKSRGTSTYYYHPQSYQLARMIHRKVLEKLKLNDFGLYYDNLALCRPTQMPAVLVEPAFIMHPEEEMLIASESYRQKCSDAIVSALEEFLKKSKE